MDKYGNIISLISQIRENGNRMITKELRRHGITELAPSHGDILVQLYGTCPLSMGQLTEAIHKDKSTVTALVNKLVKLGYVRKRKSFEDSRMTYVELTEKGTSIEKDFFEISETVLKKIYKGFEDEEKAILISKLKKMVENK